MMKENSDPMMRAHALQTMVKRGSLAHIKIKILIARLYRVGCEFAFQLGRFLSSVYEFF